MATSYLLKFSYGTVVMPLVLTGGAGWTLYSTAPDVAMSAAGEAVGRSASSAFSLGEPRRSGIAGPGMLQMVSPVSGAVASSEVLPTAGSGLGEKMDPARLATRPVPHAGRAMRDGVEVIRLALPEAKPLPQTVAEGAIAPVATAMDQPEVAASATVAANLAPARAAAWEAGVSPGATPQAPGDVSASEGPSLIGLASEGSPLSGQGNPGAMPAVPGGAEVRPDPGLVQSPGKSGSSDIEMALNSAAPRATATAAASSGLTDELAATASPGDRIAPRVPSATRAAASVMAVMKPASSGPTRKQVVGSRVYSVTQDTINFAIPVQINGRQAGLLPLQISDGNKISVKLADFLEMFRDDPAAADLAPLAGTQAAQEYVTLERIRAAGIPLRYDVAQDRLTL